MLRDKEAVRRTLGYLPQEFGVYPKVTAEDLLDHFAVLKGITDRAERRRLVTALLEQTNLQRDRAKQLGGFSGGMRQRFGIAVALLGNPRLIIVDEPTAGLDPEERVRFLNLLAELGQNSIVILSTHIVDDVSELCSRVAIIDRGRIRLEDDPQAAVARLHGRIWRRVVTRDELARHQERFAVLSTKLLAGRTVVRVLADARPEPGYEPAEPGLEDVYFAAMRVAHAPEHEAVRRRRAAGCTRFRSTRGRGRDGQFLSVLRWEVVYYLRRISTWVYFGIYAAIGFLFMLLSGGAFKEASAVFGGGGKVLANAPFAHRGS